MGLMVGDWGRLVWLDGHGLNKRLQRYGKSPDMFNNKD